MPIFVNSKGHAFGREFLICEDSSKEWQNYRSDKARVEFSSKNGDCAKQLAHLHFQNDINQTGWAYLDMEIIDDSLKSSQQAYIAGYLEGVATRDLISLHIRNTISEYCLGVEKYCRDVHDFTRQNLDWMISMIRKNQDDSYWQQVFFTLAQFKGLQDAYYRRKIDLVNILQINITGSSDEIPIEPIMFLHLWGDLRDLQIKFKKPETPKKVKQGSGHCSALVKLLPGNSDLLFSHSTWDSYSTMLRIQKKYAFKSDNYGHTVAITSYPGRINSYDDFILTSSKLAVLETTYANHNEELNKLITPQTVPYWIRSQIASRVASTGLEWAEIFSMYNSGTYNSEWVIVDYKKFRRGLKEQPQGLIHVLGQIPGRTVHTDMTTHLVNTSYWAGFNRASLPEIFQALHSQEMVDKYGDWFSHDGSPRAQIFARDHKKVVDMESMIKLSRYNDYTNDPLSRCNCTPPYSAANAIAARNDLNPKDGVYPFSSLEFHDSSATDMKVTNSELINTLQFTAIAGPTHDPTPVFDWSNDPYDGTVLHFGQPTRWEPHIFPHINIMKLVFFLMFHSVMIDNYIDAAENCISMYDNLFVASFIDCADLYHAGFVHSVLQVGESVSKISSICQSSRQVVACVSDNYFPCPKNITNDDEAHECTYKYLPIDYRPNTTHFDLQKAVQTFLSKPAYSGFDSKRNMPPFAVIYQYNGQISGNNFISGIKALQKAGYEVLFAAYPLTKDRVTLATQVIPQSNIVNYEVPQLIDPWDWMLTRLNARYIVPTYNQTGLTGNFSSPNYPKNYPNLALQEFSISAPTDDYSILLTFNDLFIPMEDKLQCYNGKSIDNDTISVY